MKAIVHAIVAAVVAAAGPTTAQTVYRCGHTYSPVPCPNAKELHLDARPTAAQRAEARRVALVEKRLAAEMARDRRAEEAAHPPALASSLGPAPVHAAASAPAKKHGSKTKKKTASPDDALDFVAGVPKVKKVPS